MGLLGYGGYEGGDGQNVSALRDMFNGGGAGGAGDTFSGGGGYSAILNGLGVRPMGYADRQAQSQPDGSVRPQARYQAPPQQPMMQPASVWPQQAQQFTAPPPVETSSLGDYGILRRYMMEAGILPQQPYFGPR